MALNGRNSVGVARNMQGLKKRPWTASEDKILVEYVETHGEGKWNSVQMYSGLTRSGKSCRHRWANHLRPYVKKDAFSAEEERSIVEFHAKFGNKWARIAAQIPDRTDNEIKNYWHTRAKRNKRAGLPLYPPGIIPTYHLLDSSSSSRPSSSKVPNKKPSSSHKLKSAPPNDLISQNERNNFFFNNQLQPLHDNDDSLALSLQTASNSSFFNQGMLNSFPMPSIQENSLNFGTNIPCTNMGVSGIPSIQPLAVLGTAIQVPFYAIPTLDYGVENYKSGESEFRGGNSNGLLGYIGMIKDAGSASGVHENLLFTNDVITFKNNYNGYKAPKEGIKLIDDDLENLLDNFPLSVPIPNWDEMHPCVCSNLTNGTNNESESQLIVSRYNQGEASSRVGNQD